VPRCCRIARLVAEKDARPPLRPWGEESAHVKSSAKRWGKHLRPGQRKAIPPEPTRPTKKPRALARAVAGVARGVKAAASKLGSDSPSRVVKAAPKKSVPRAKRLPRARRADPSAVLERLSRAIERPHVELAFSDAWQLL